MRATQAIRWIMTTIVCILLVYQIHDLKSNSLFIVERRYPREFFSLEEFERRAAAGRNMRYLFIDTGLLNRGNGIAAAHNRYRALFRREGYQFGYFDSSF